MYETCPYCGAKYAPLSDEQKSCYKTDCIKKARQEKHNGGKP